jgi:hypothetical protein
MAQDAAPSMEQIDQQIHGVATRFRHIPHPRIVERKNERPVRTTDERVGFNGKFGLLITTIVGTMWAAYLFVVIAAIGGFAIVANNTTLNLVIILISQTFLQLVLLPIIIVGQNIQGRASDKRAEQTYKDAEAILHECVQLQEHLLEQDKILDDVIEHVKQHDAVHHTGPQTQAT